MDYATKELTQSLQQIAAGEVGSGGKRGENETSEFIVPSAYGVRGLTLPAGVDRFLESRREFQEKTRDVSIGSY